MRQRLRQEPIREPGVPGQQRPMQVRPDGAPHATPLLAAPTVVSEPGDDATERRRARVEMRTTRMVLEAGERPRHAGLELALEQNVPDHPSLARHGLQRKEAGAAELDAAEISVRTAEELVATAHGEQGSTALGRGKQTVRLRREVARDELLLAILTTADVEEIVVAGPDVVADAQLDDVELVTTPRGSTGQHRDVAAIRVDVQVVRIQMPDAEPHAARSQDGR